MVPAFLRVNRIKLYSLVILLFFYQWTEGQEILSLSDLSAFKQPAANWHIAGDVWADLSRNNVLTTSNGTGILVNLTMASGNGQLVTNFEHGDLDLELDYMMAKGSNSGIYLQGRYEVQLLDSWGVLQPRSLDNGGIYERWDDSKPDGQKGYEGTAPRQNASKAPGLWQHIKISFQSPRFAGGKKISNAKMLSVELNGVLIQENVELSGPTRSPLINAESELGPLMIQGDHGPVAFRNIKVSNYNKPRPSLTNVNTAFYTGKYVQVPDFTKLRPVSQKPNALISSNIPGLPANEFLIRYTGTLQIKEAGNYHFRLNTFGGGGQLKINNQVVIPFTNWNAEGRTPLPAGDLPIELVYSKYVDWAKPSLALQIEGPGIRNFTISDTQIPALEEVDPIPVKAAENTILRSFVDLPSGARVTHAVNVGSPEKIHYTYDMDHGMIVQAWRGEFLDATPMWHERGDGSSRAAGAVLNLGRMEYMMNKMSSANASWSKDTAGAGFRPKGYTLDEKFRPVFTYHIYGAIVKDAIRVTENNQGLQREITISGSTDKLYVRIAEGKTIEEKPDGFYLVNDKSYYLFLDDTSGEKPIIRDQQGNKELIVPAKSKIRYTILF